MSDFRISPDSGLVFTRCPACGQEVVPSYNGWRRHQPFCPGPCPDCGHSWRAHMGRNGGERCHYARIGGACPCRRKNPDVEAEDRLAAWVWNREMGRPAR